MAERSKALDSRTLNVNFWEINACVGSNHTPVNLRAQKAKISFEAVFVRGK